MASLSSVLLSACTGVGDDVAVGALVLLQGEARQVEPRHDLHGVHVLPLVHQVVRGPAVCSGTSEGEEMVGDTHSWLSAGHTLACPGGRASGPWDRPGSGRSCSVTLSTAHWANWGSDIASPAFLTPR